MSDSPIYCPAQTYRGSRLEPPEWCETEVEQHGTLCDRHDEDDRADELYERYLEDKAEREADPDYYYRDFGD